MGCGASSVELEESNHRAGKSPSSSPIRSSQNQQSNTNSNDILVTPAEFDDKDVNILMLGPSDCGKTTLFRQFTIDYLGGFDNDEKYDLAQVIKVNLISIIKKLVEATQSSGRNVADNLLESVETIKALQCNEEELTPMIANKIESVWNDPAIKTTYKNDHSIGLSDNDSFLLDNVKRIASDNYFPTDEDILKSLIRTAGIRKCQLLIDNRTKTELIDVGGQKCERPKWKRCFKQADFLIFVVSLSDFDQLMFEDDSLKRSEDSINLFQNMVNSPTFSQKPIFLVLNKIDIFEKKLKEFPGEFKKAYPDYEGDISSVDACIQHVIECYLRRLSPDRNKAQAWVKTIITCALDKNDVYKLFNLIAKSIISTESRKLKQPSPQQSQQQKQQSRQAQQPQKMPRPQQANQSQLSQQQREQPQQPNQKQQPQQSGQKSQSQHQHQSQPQKHTNSPPKSQPKANEPLKSVPKDNISSPKIIKIEKKPDEVSVYEYVSEYVTDDDSYSEYYESA